jgi:hypothetical protein
MSSSITPRAVRRPLLRVVALAAAASLGTLLSACDREPQGSTAPDGQFLPAPTTPEGPADASYTTRGRVIALPGPIRAKQFLKVHHELIPEFKNRRGEVVGMKEMIMDFPDVAAGDVVKGIRVGQDVRITFEVRWNTSPRTLITMIEPLPEGETLTLQPIVEVGGT